jgi:uncharacterized protein (DUF305 family)
MKNKTLRYSSVGLIVSATLTFIVAINHTQAQNQAQNQQQNTHMRMGMNQQQIDQHFIEMMIPHHQGAVDMANLALTKAKHPELKKLAESIKTSQTKEIEEMKVWYKKWYGTDVPTTSGMGMTMQCGMGMNMMGMMNMDLTALNNASNFDQVFIEQMIPHHQSAVMMAGMILNSSHPELRNLAKAIIQTQSAEIEQMRAFIR